MNRCLLIHIFLLLTFPWFAQEKQRLTIVTENPENEIVLNDSIFVIGTFSGFFSGLSVNVKVLPKGKLWGRGIYEENVFLNGKAVNKYYSENKFISKDINSFIYAPVTLEIQNEKESFINTELFRYLIGSAILIGTGAVYYKFQADAQYETYKKTGNSLTHQRTEKFDTISGIFSGALQINFALLIYFFLTE
ncbi:MAG: hypothetical protein K9I69_06640 [Ignavibacteriales bacterium]|nr:hypothetical protein [Ignavibacteriales bacterium]MCF8435323.1 hypothetical protein [Ignavibacteriales bacterium]